MMKQLYILFLGILVSSSLLAQVTIGSGVQPNAGALLDLKEDNNLGANSTRGLAMPRVELKNINDLSDVGVTGTGAAQIGMLVYHVTTDVCNVNPNGLYVWNGTIWQSLGGKPTKITTSTAGLAQPNAYTISGKGVITIPVAKVVDVWDGASWTDENGTALLTAKTLSNLTAEVVWMDAQKVVCSIGINIAGNLRESTINLITGSQYGNAVVALKSNGQTVWSWHIWVTPEIGSVTANGNTWMDRNLGATTATLGAGNARGLHYQWGRKDPFGNKLDWNDDGQETTLYLLGGGNATLDKTYVSTAVAQNNLTKSIENPLTFIKSATSPYFDWYAATNQWNSRWGENGAKSVTDPCPEGWRVPDVTGAVSPWNGLTAGTGTDFDTNKGWNWTTFDYYSAGGSRLGLNANLTTVGADRAGYYWTASSGNMGLPVAMYFNKTTVLPYSNSYGAEGFSVRCVKE